jgi:hypothetical protein
MNTDRRNGRGAPLAANAAIGFKDSKALKRKDSDPLSVFIRGKIVFEFGPSFN